MESRQVPLPEGPVREVRIRFLRTGERSPSAARAHSARTVRQSAHDLARRMLAEFAGASPEEVRFRTLPGGRPEPDAPPAARRFRFSLSHAEGVCLCAVVEGRPVGADVESLRELGPDPMAVASVVCSAREVEVLRETPASDRPMRLLGLWIVKEAVAKALGRGFRLPLDQVEVHRDGSGRPVLRFDPRTGEDAARWRLAFARIGPSHAAAVAVRGSPGERFRFRIEAEPDAPHEEGDRAPHPPRRTSSVRES